MYTSKYKKIASDLHSALKMEKNGVMINVYSQGLCKLDIQFNILRKTVPISQNCTFFPNFRVLGNFQRLITQIQKTQD